jgi:UDP-glucose 4-epimerase
MEVLDCARAMVHLTESTDAAVNCFNLGTDDTCSVRRIAEIVVEETGFENVSIEYTGGDRGWAGDVPKTMLDPSTLFATGFEPNFNSEDAIRHTATTLIQEIGL